MSEHAAAELVRKAHEGQTDKAGKPYLEHLLGVASLVPHHLRTAALAHDLLEDTKTTVRDMVEAGFEANDIRLVNLLTLKKGQRRDDYLRAIREDKEACTIKIADVLNNVSRLHQIENEDERTRLLLKYQTTLETLVND